MGHYHKTFESKEGCVWKHVFEFDDAIAETVLYKYESFEKRTVICCSVQSGCPVGCTFCGTGKHFVRNLTAEEIVDQIGFTLGHHNIKAMNCERFQIMFMSMGEPMLNWDNVHEAIYMLHWRYPNAELLISTVGVDDDQVFAKIIKLSQMIDKVGLQFSIHEATDRQRNLLIPFKNKMNLNKLRDAGLAWWRATGRKVFLNYCVTEKNATYDEVYRLVDRFSPVVFNFTFSVVCNPDQSNPDRDKSELARVEWFAGEVAASGHSTRVFNPAGQDDIGGGCGQLWYVQEWFSKHNAEGGRK